MLIKKVGYYILKVAIGVMYFLVPIYYTYMTVGSGGSYEASYAILFGGIFNDPESPLFSRIIFVLPLLGLCGLLSDTLSEEFERIKIYYFLREGALKTWYRSKIIEIVLYITSVYMCTIIIHASIGGFLGCSWQNGISIVSYLFLLFIANVSTALWLLLLTNLVGLMSKSKYAILGVGSFVFVTAFCTQINQNVMRWNPMIRGMVHLHGFETVKIINKTSELPFVVIEKMNFLYSMICIWLLISGLIFLGYKIVCYKRVI